MHNHDEQSELNALVNEEAGKLANKAAEASLMLLAMLGAYHGPVTPEYQMEVAKGVVRILLGLASVRACIEHASGEMTDEQRVMYVARLIAAAFDIDSATLIAELAEESRAA